MMTEIRPSAEDFAAVCAAVRKHNGDRPCAYRACFRAAQCHALLRLTREMKGFIALEMLEAADTRRPQ
jgi:hypothetical protein